MRFEYISAKNSVFLNTYCNNTIKMSRSAYYLTLSGDIKCRYDQKLKIIGNIDPYMISSNELCFDLRELPNLTVMDLVNYLILTHSFYTGQQLKAYKSLQAYKYYQSGSVLQVLAKMVNVDVFVILSKVRHSQRTREKALEVWIILLKDGSISSAHCTCMAGLGEVCTHIATVLFYIHDRPTTIDDNQACTSQLATWPVPPLKNVEMVRIRDMDWMKKKRVALPQKSAPSMDEEEICDLLRKIQLTGVTSGICRLIEPFASELVTNEPENLPKSLDLWYNSDLINKSYEELLNFSKNMNLIVSEEQIKIIEMKTREQSQNNTWFKYRAGRITASQFKSVCRTSIQNPSLTVIKGVCYPQKVTFYSKATSYGLKNEKKALQSYEKTFKTQHQNFVMTASGFLISQKHPELGASPDGLVSCDCCGLGCVEVKCPYLLNSDDITLQEYADKKYSCLVSHNEELTLDKKHCYYFQIQLQMYVTNRKYCDFVIWSKNSLYIERVFFDNNFCLENVAKVLDFHYYVIKPELLAKHFTEKSGRAKLTLWCLCKKPDDGRPMLKCDSDDCEIQWFHFECVNISEVPVTNWFCQNCI